MLAAAPAPAAHRPCTIAAPPPQRRLHRLSGPPGTRRRAGGGALYRRRSRLADVAPVPLPTSSQPDGIYLQLGAFGAREGAEEFRIKVYQQLSWLTETAYIVARDRLFRVQLGPYKDRAEAAGVAEKIRQALQFSPMFILR